MDIKAPTTGLSKQLSNKGSSARLNVDKGMSPLGKSESLAGPGPLIEKLHLVVSRMESVIPPAVLSCFQILRSFSSQSCLESSTN